MRTRKLLPAGGVRTSGYALLTAFALSICGVVASAASEDEPGAEPAADLKRARSLLQSGQSLLKESRYPEALKAFEEMERFCSPGGACQAAARFYVGRCRLDAGEYDRAEAALTKVLEIYDRTGFEEGHAVAQYMLGRIRSAQGRYSDAFPLFDQAEKALRRSGNSAELFNCLVNRALASIAVSQYRRAKADLDDAEPLAASEAQRAHALLARGAISTAQQRHEEAMRLFEEALEAFKASDNLSGIATALTNMGAAHAAVSEYEAAMKKHREALGYAVRAGDPVRESIAVNNMAEVYVWLGDYDKARRAYEKSVDIAKRIGIKRFHALRLNNLGAVNYFTGDYDAAERLYREALGMSREMEAPECAAWALHNLANMVKDRGRFAQSLAYSLEAVKIAREAGNGRLEATALLRLGNLYAYLGDFEKAFTQYERAAALQKEIGDRRFLGVTLSDLADMRARRGRFNRAERNYEEAIRLHGEIGVPRADLLGRYALYFIEKPRLDHRRAVDEDLRRSELKRAEELLGRARAELKPRDASAGMLLTYVQGSLEVESDPNAAAATFRELVDTARGAGNLKYGFLGHTGLGEAHERIGDLEQAAQAYHDAVEYAERVRSELEPAARKTFLHGEEILGVKHTRPYEGLARTRLKLGRDLGALRASEFTKARAFSENLAIARGDNAFGVDKDLRERLEEAERRLTAARKRVRRVERSAFDPAAIEQARTDAAEAERLYEAARRDVKAAAPVYYRTLFPAGFDLSSAPIRDDELLLVYDVTDSALLAFLVKGRKTAAAKLIPVGRRELDALVSTFREPLDLSDATTNAEVLEELASFDMDTGRRLFDVLVRPFMESIPAGAHVTMIPDDCLGSLPFEALVTSPEGKVSAEEGRIPVVEARFFGDRNPTSYYHSLSALAAARSVRGAERSPERLLVMADPVFRMRDARVTEKPVRTAARSDMNRKRLYMDLMSAMEEERTGFLGAPGRLELTARLAERLSETFKGKTDVYTGLDASKEKLFASLKPNLRAYGKIVFATHGYFGDDLPGIREPVLLLTLVPPGTDGFLRMSEVMGLRLAADIVALTACQSGVGPHISGEGTMGMGRAFQYAGAQSALMSLWSVDQESSVRLVERFFSHVRSGTEPVRALRSARDDIRREGWDHPFFWAAFILTGESR